MKTELINISEIPNKKELVSLLGEDMYQYYINIYVVIITYLNPEIEIQDNAGRRGKYFNGFRKNEYGIILDMYLLPNLLKCELKLTKISFAKIQNKKGLFGDITQISIDSTAKTIEKSSGAYLEVFIDNNEAYDDFVSMVKIL